MKSIFILITIIFISGCLPEKRDELTTDEIKQALQMKIWTLKSPPEYSVGDIFELYVNLNHEDTVLAVWKTEPNNDSKIMMFPIPTKDAYQIHILNNQKNGHTTHNAFSDHEVWGANQISFVGDGSIVSIEEPIGYGWMTASRNSKPTQSDTPFNPDFEIKVRIKK